MSNFQHSFKNCYQTMGRYSAMLILPVLHRSQDRSHFPISVFITPLQHLESQGSFRGFINFFQQEIHNSHERKQLSITISAQAYPQLQLLILTCSSLFSAFLLNASMLQVTSLKQNPKVVTNLRPSLSKKIHTYSFKLLGIFGNKFCQQKKFLSNKVKQQPVRLIIYIH